MIQVCSERFGEALSAFFNEFLSRFVIYLSTHAHWLFTLAVCGGHSCGPLARPAAHSVVAPVIDLSSFSHSYMSQSQSQSWPLSQKAGKRNGICSVCFATRQLHNKDGSVHLHGPRHQPCLGSNLPPIDAIPPGSDASGSVGARAHPPDSVPSIADTAVMDPGGPKADPVGSSISHSVYSGPIVKHIPRSARPHIATELVSVLDNILSDPDDITQWALLLAFGPIMLRAPPRTGRRHNLATTLIKRDILQGFADSASNDSTSRSRPTKQSDDQSLAAAVMAKIEDGNIKAAIRIITSGEGPSCCSKRTVL